MLRTLVFTHLAFALAPSAPEQGRGNLLSSALLCIAEARVGLRQSLVWTEGHPPFHLFFRMDGATVFTLLG